MSFILLLIFGVLNLVLKADCLPEESSKFVDSFKNDKKVRAPDIPASYHNIPQNSYFENDNIMRFPDQLYQEKPKKIRKSPKRTIQKIIKRNHSKTRKVFLRRATTKPPSTASDDEESYTDGQKATTEKQFSKKRHNRKPTNYLRNPTHFHGRRDFHRAKRMLEKDNVYILRDFDEIEFLSKEKGDNQDVVNAHIKRYW